MSCYRGRGKSRRRENRNRSGRGCGSGKPTTKKSVDDYVYHLGSAKRASEVKTTTDFLINYIHLTYPHGGDIAEALRDLRQVDLSIHKPTLNRSTDNDEATRELFNRQYKIEFEVDWKHYQARVDTYDINQVEAYEFLISRCSKSMKDEIEGRKDFEAKIYNNPIELLKAIKQHALECQEDRYDMAVVADAFENFFNTRQHVGEKLQDYTIRFEDAKEYLESGIGGPIILTKIVTNTPGYSMFSDEERDKCEKEAYSRFIAYKYMESADQSKYGSIMNGLATQKSLKNDQYPRTLTEANRVLRNHRFDPGFMKPKNKQKNTTFRHKRSGNSNESYSQSVET